MKRSILIYYFTHCTIFSSIAQTGNGTLTGKITDVISKQPIIGTTITIIGTNFGTVADANGEYRIDKIPYGNYQVKASSIGYQTIIKSDVIINSSKPSMVDIELQELLIQFEGITVTADLFQNSPTEITSVRNFSYEEIRRAPGGFEDVVRALSILPGVAQADAGRNDLIVRGGAPSENLYLVDGLVIPNINHFGSQGATGGPLSFINLDFVKETSFSTGGFSVIYGDKLSSVLQINLREGRKDRIGGKGTIAATQFGINLEGPLSSKTNFLFSARRSYLDWIFKAAGFGFVPEYYDLLTKITSNIDNSNLISFLFVGAFDNVKFFNNTSEQRFDNSRILGSDQTNYIAGLTYRHLFSNGFYDVSLSRTYNDFDTQQRDSLLNPIFLNISREQENVLKSDLIYKFSSRSELNIGASIKLIKFNADIKFPFFRTSFGDSLKVTSLNTKENFSKADLFVQYSNMLFNYIHINLGVRFDYFNAIENKTVLSPRLSVSYKFNELTSFNVATGIYHQAPSYIWLAAEDVNRSLKPIRVNQFILGVDHRLREDINLKLEGFYKNYTNYPTSLLRPYLVLANTGAGFAGSDDNFSQFGLEPLTSSGKGYSQGVELSLQKKSSIIPHYGILSVTFSEAFFTSLDGIKRAGTYSQKWIINLSAGYIFNERWEASLKFRFATGNPYTPFNLDGTQSINLLNSVRFNPNHSLDIRVDRRWNFSSWSLVTYLDVQNIYSKKNQSTIRWNPRTKSVAESSSIGILPSIGISAEL
jgi:hypothetical protein